MRTSDDSDVLTWELLRRIVPRPNLPPDRRAAAAWMLTVLESQLGDRWPAKVSEGHDSLSSLLVWSGTHDVGFGTMLELALRLEQFQGTPGFAKMRKDLRCDVRGSRLFHHRAVLEVAALGATAGQADIEFEPPVQDVPGPADLRIRHERGDIVVEVKILETDQAFREAEDRFDHLQLEALRLRVEHGVDFDVDAGVIPDDATLDQTLTLMRDVAAASAGSSLWVERNLGPEIKVAAGPETTTPGIGIRGPLYQQDDALRRLRQALAQKAAKYKGGRPVWLRVDLIDGIFPISRWAQVPLAQQLNEIATALRSQLGTATGIAGIVLTSGAIALSTGTAGQSVRNPDTGDLALHRQLPFHRERRTFVLPLHRQAVDDSIFWRTMYDNEPTWLAHALTHTGLSRLGELGHTG